MSLAKYEAVFKDKFGTDSIIIQNDFEELFFELRGVKFQGISLDYFDLVEHENYSKEQLNQFSLNKLSNSTDDHNTCEKLPTLVGFRLRGTAFLSFAESCFPLYHE